MVSIETKDAVKPKNVELDNTIFEIHKFYSKQHHKLKPGSHFEDFKNTSRMEKVKS